MQGVLRAEAGRYSGSPQGNYGDRARVGQGYAAYSLTRRSGVPMAGIAAFMVSPLPKLGGSLGGRFGFTKISMGARVPLETQGAGWVTALLAMGACT